MKKIFIILFLSMTMISCGGSDPKPVEATYGPIGPDSSMILPPLIDTTIPVNGDSVKLDSLNVVD